MSIRATLLLILLLGAVAATGRGHALGAYPEATEWSPTGSNAALEGPIAITWTMRMSGATVEAAFRLTDGDRVWSGVDFEWVHSPAPPWTSHATPDLPLAPETEYTATIFATAREATGTYALDQNGNGFGGEATDSLAWTFRTENGRPPGVQWTTPADGAQNVSVAAAITLAFDEPMDRDSVEAALAFSPDLAGTLSWDTEGTEVTFLPGLRLLYGTAYEVRVKGAVARDANGALFDGDRDGFGGDDFAFRFTTEPDTSPPRVLAVAPLPGPAVASVSAQVAIRFSEAMNRTSVELAFSYSDPYATRDARNGTFAWSGVTFPDDSVTFNPDENFPFAADITVVLDGSTAEDRFGFPLDGDGDGTAEGSPLDDYGWTFSTEAADGTRPVVLATDPTDGATSVPETAVLRVTFSEAMNRTSVEEAFVLSDPVRNWTKADGWFSWARGDEEFTYTPATNLPFNQPFAITISNDAQDVNENALDGDGSGGNFTAPFRTRAEPDTTPPRVESTIPLSGTVDVARDARLWITFDDAMDRANSEVSLLLEAESDFEPALVLIGDFVWDAEDHAVSFRALEGPLDWGTQYQVFVGLAARNVAGVPLAAPYTFSFTTERWSGRVVGAVLSTGAPVAGATVRLGNGTTQTAANGTFAFPNVMAGTYDLVVSKAGYVTERRVVTLDHRFAVADATLIDLGEITLERESASSPVVFVGVLLIGLGAIVGLALVLRRRRQPPLEEFEDLEEESGEAYP